MKSWVKMGAAIGGVAVAGVAAVAAGSVRWGRATTREVARLDASGNGRAEDAGAGTEGPYSPEQLTGLPAPVVRFFEFALEPGQQPVRRATVRQSGEFSTRPGAWSPLLSVQRFSVHPPGFVWDASIHMMPLIPTLVRDSYIGGAGSMHATVGGLVTVTKAGGGPEMAAGSLLRYLAETYSFPTALLPREGVRWSPIDDRTARATLTDGETTVSMDVAFGERGEMTTISAMRHREVNGSFLLTPWIAHLRDWARVGGMMIPRTGEVAWVIDDKSVPYWRGTLVDVSYEFDGREGEHADSSPRKKDPVGEPVR